MERTKDEIKAFLERHARERTTLIAVALIYECQQKPEYLQFFSTEFASYVLALLPICLEENLPFTDNPDIVNHFYDQEQIWLTAGSPMFRS
ncbi:MAG: hypothetical protein ABI758_02545 [Candidatus Woesebacteria bacterium]